MESIDACFPDNLPCVAQAMIERWQRQSAGRAEAQVAADQDCGLEALLSCATFDEDD